MALVSVIARHLLDPRNTTDIAQAFKVISKQQDTVSLRFAEAVAIIKIKPDLFIQKETVISL